MFASVIFSSVDRKGPDEGPIMGQSTTHIWCKTRGLAKETPVETLERRPLAHGVEEPSLGSKDMVGLPSNVAGPPVTPDHTIILDEGIIRIRVTLLTIYALYSTF